ncbi:hypothetical protein ACNGTO_03110 [Bisgaard Taxon 45]
MGVITEAGNLVFELGAFLRVVAFISVLYAIGKLISWYDNRKK